MAAPPPALAALQGFTAAPPAEVTVNGAPLSSVVAGLVHALNEQQQQFLELREYTYRTNQEQWERIVALEASVARLDNDVAIHTRPLAGHASVADALQSLEARAQGIELNRRGAASNAVALRAEETLRRSAFSKWLRFLRLRKSLKSMMRGTASGVRALYLAKWLAHRKLQKQRIARARHVASLLRCNQKRLAHAFVGKWRAYTDGQRTLRATAHMNRVQTASNAAVITHRGLCRRRFITWVDFVEARRVRRAQSDAADKMAIFTHRGLAGRFMRRWMAAEEAGRARRRKHQVAAALIVESSKELLAQRLRGWINLVQRRRTRLASAALVPRLHHAQCLRLAGRYFAKLGRFAVIKAQRRQRNETIAMVSELTRRCDTLGSQIDISLRTMSNTNNVLSKVVERVVKVETAVGQQPGTHHHDPQASGVATVVSAYDDDATSAGTGPHEYL